MTWMIRGLGLFIVATAATVCAAEPLIAPGKKALPLPGESFQFDGHEAFVILPPEVKKPTPWVWYAPTLPGLPGKEEAWMIERFLESGVAIAGVDVGESFGSPDGRAVYERFHAYLVGEREFSGKPVLLARSRGGLMLYSWATENPQSVGAVAGIYPVCSLVSYPGVQRAAGAYQLTPEELEQSLAKHDPINRLEALARAKVPILHIHGDQDRVVPLEANSAELVRRYRAFGGPAEVEVIAGQGHNMWRGWFESGKLAEFIIAQARGNEASRGGKIKAGTRIERSGTLEGGLAAIGGETTGWRLTWKEGGRRGSLEVDMSAIKDAGALDGARVTVSGTVVVKHYVERGEVLILKAKKAIREE